MSEAVEPSNIFEIYRRECMGYANGHPPQSKITVSGRQFTRTVFRPKEGGPDLLVDQFVENTSTYAHLITLEVADFESKERFREKIVANPPPLRVQPEGSNWDWSRVADYVCDLVPVEVVHAASGRISVIAMEAFGKLSIIEEDNGWLSSLKAGVFTHQKIPPLIDGNCLFCDEATIGSHELNDLIRFYCGHVFHRKCLFPLIWFEQVWAKKLQIGCPTHCQHRKCTKGNSSDYSQVSWSWIVA